MTEKLTDEQFDKQNEAAVSLTRAFMLLRELSKDERDRDRREQFLLAFDYVMKASDCLNRVLLLEYPDLEDDLEDGLDEPMSSIVTGLKDENPDVQNAYAGMIKRGESPEHADQEIGRAFLGCLWEQNKGMPDRFQEVFAGLAAGKSSADLFPDALYTAGNETSN